MYHTTQLKNGYTGTPLQKKFYEDGRIPKDVLDIKKERTEKNWLDLSSL